MFRTKWYFCARGEVPRVSPRHPSARSGRVIQPDWNLFQLTFILYFHTIGNIVWEPVAHSHRCSYVRSSLLRLLTNPYKLNDSYIFEYTEVKLKNLTIIID